MPYTVINTTNAFDPTNNVRFATEAEADAAARQILAMTPGAVLSVAQIINDYSATVTVTATAPTNPE